MLLTPSPDSSSSWTCFSTEIWIDSEPGLFSNGKLELGKGNWRQLFCNKIELRFASNVEVKGAVHAQFVRFYTGTNPGKVCSIQCILSMFILIISTLLLDPFPKLQPNFEYLWSTE